MDKAPNKNPPLPKGNPNEEKNAANLKRALGQALLAFEKNKEWADYGHWLQKVAKCLEDYPSYQIPEKLTFAKRLAQCLNPNLPPAIHGNAIQVYSLIFRNMKDGGYNWCEDLGLYSLGIFPLFQYASFQVKPKILSLYREHYFPLGKQLIPCITGLVVSILPGIEEQNETLQKDVFSTLDQLSNCVTKKYFVGAVWMAILRCPKVKLAGLKYLSKRLQRTYIDPEEIEEGEHSDSESEDQRNEASSPDQNNDKLNQSPEKETPLTHADAEEEDEGSNPDQEDASVTTKDDVVVVEDTSRIERYQLTVEDEAFLKSLDNTQESQTEIEYPNKSSLIINALISALEEDSNLVQKMCLDFLHSHFKLASDLFTENEKAILVEATLNLLIKKDQQVLRRVYTWIFGPPDMENKYQVTEKNRKVLDYIISAFINIFSREPTDSYQSTLPLKVLQTFYMEHDHLVEETLPSLAIPFLSYISKYSQPGTPFADDVHKAGARFMENIASYFSTLLTSLSDCLEQEIQEQNIEKCLEIINLIEFTFKLDASISNKEENNNYLEQKEYLKAIISGILKSTSSISPDQENLIPFIETALSLNLTLISKLEKVESDLLRLIAEKNLSEADIVRIMPSRSTDHGLEKTLELFNRFYERIVHKALSFESESQISQKFLNMLSYASETIVKVQVFHTENSLTEIPSWIYSVFQCIKSTFPSVSIIGIKVIQSLLISKQNHPVYDSIRSMITSEGNKGKTSDIVKRTNEKLWSLLDVHYIQNTVSDLLVTFQIHFPQTFAETISSSFRVPSITEKEAAIRRFSSFWKLSSDMAQSRFIESGIGLFMMLDFLDNHNPLLRHSTKTWLLDSIPFLYRIIDPVFEILMQCNDNHHLRLYKTETQQYFFTEVYDTDLVQNAFRKLKSVLITSNELFIRYITSIKISEKLKKYTEFFTNNEIENPENCTYFDLLVNLCLKYVQGHAIESLSPKFQNQNASVNASASEFMEILISYIENKELSSKMTHFIMEPLLIVLNHSMNCNDYVLQVQLLNLFKVILFQSSFCSFEATKSNCEALLASKRFIPNLLRGLHVDQHYVRVQYINFISLCVSVLTENLSQQEILTNSVISILRAYFDIILSKKLDKNENNDEFEPWETGNVNVEEDHKSKKLESPTKKGSNSEEEQIKHARTLFTQTQQNQNEIYILLEGVRKILDYFLKFNVILDNNTDHKGNVEEGGVLLTVRDIFTFGLLRNSPEVKKEVLATAQHADTAKAILGDIYRVVFILIYSWRLSKEFRQTADFTSAGISTYTFEKYNEINKMIKDCHMKIDIQAKNVKSLIILMLKSLMLQYPKETFNSFLNYWMKECEKSSRGDGLAFNPRMMKEIEILITMNVSTDMIFSALSKNQIIVDLNNYYQKKQKESKKAPAILDYDIVKVENQIFFFLYTFMAYSYIDINFLKKDNLFKLWTTALNFTKLFTPSKATSTHLWILEIFHLLALKYNPKEILGDHKLKKEMHAQINALLLAVANTCAKNTVIFFNHPQGSETQFRTVLPFSPTVYEIYKSYAQSNKDTSKTSDASATSSLKIQHQESEALLDSVKIEKLMFDDFREELSEPGLLQRYRLFAFKTLKQIGLPVLQNSYSPEKIDRIVVRTKEFMTIIFPLLENKSPENQPFLECASELLYAQLDASRSFLFQDYKKNIIDIFKGNDFFKCNKQTLKYWSSIIDWVVSMDKGDIFTEFLTKMSSFSFLYSKDSETKQKIKAFERICFIIYSGERDKYQDKLFVLLEKMGEVIKNADSAHPSLLILVLFCIRILILRLSPSSLNELFRHIWPILLTLLMQLFSRREASSKNPNVILAALKLLEMFSIVQLEEFYINQWVFVFDYFGLKITKKEGEEKHVEEVVEAGDTVVVEQRPHISGFIFQPYVTYSLQDNLKINYKNQVSDTQQSYEKLERKIIMTMTNVEDEEEIRNKALELMQYLMKQNEFRCEADPQQVESLIEGDFISLDEYILKMN